MEPVNDVEDQVDTPRAGDKLPPREEVAAAMKEKLLTLLPKLQEKKNPIKPEEYFTEKWIAPCFWTARKEEFGGKPWLDDALFIFAHSRGFDYESGAKRFFKFNQVAFPTGVVSLDEMAEDIATTLGAMGTYVMPDQLDEKGRCVCCLTMSNVSWDNMTVKACQRAHIWLFWQWATMWGTVAQTKGISFVMCMKGMTMSQIKPEFENWCNKVFMECLPTKIAAMYMSYEPFWFGNIMWPMMKLGMKKKLKERVVWLGDKPEKVGPRYLESAYCVPKGQEDTKNFRAVIPVEMGGTYNLTIENGDAYFRGKWKVSDETVPEGCAPPPKKKKK